MQKRRTFLKSGAGAIAVAAGSGPLAFAAENEATLRVAVIGCGWYGKTDLFHLMQVAPIEVVGLCDVDRKMVVEAAELVSQRQPSRKKPPVYGDYRQLLAEQKPEVVLIGTPDHWHCLPMVDACRAGADVYVQKPISWDVVEGQAMVAAARKYKRTVQVGLERRSTPHLLEARDRFIKSGKLGKIAHVEVFSYVGSSRSVPPGEEAPEHIDWNMYVGPAPWRDYSPRIHPRRWRACPEFSNGQTGDLGVHFFDVVRYFLGLGWPRSVSATGGIRMREDDGGLHDTQTAMFDYEDLHVVWNQRNWGRNTEPDHGWGATFHGDKGILKTSIRGYDFIPKGKGEAVHGDFVDESADYPEDVAYKPTEILAAPGNRQQMRDFLEARRKGKRPVADIEEGHISTACCILANLSMRIGRSLAWDQENGRVIGDEEANRLLARSYRGDWVHPTPENV
jgi:predicted dehydrogenase